MARKNDEGGAAGYTFAWILGLLATGVIVYALYHTRGAWFSGPLPHAWNTIKTAVVPKSKGSSIPSVPEPRARYQWNIPPAAATDSAQDDRLDSIEERIADEDREEEARKRTGNGLQRFGDLAHEDEILEEPPAPTPTYTAQKVFDNRGFSDVLQQGMPRPGR